VIVARTRHWRVELPKGADAVAVWLERDTVPRELEELGELRIDVPLAEWQRLLRLLRGDRKLLGGLLLDFARQKDRLSPVLAKDRLYVGLVGALEAATLALLECEALALAAPE